MACVSSRKTMQRPARKPQHPQTHGGATRQPTRVWRISWIRLCRVAAPTAFRNKGLVRSYISKQTSHYKRTKSIDMPPQMMVSTRWNPTHSPTPTLHPIDSTHRFKLLQLQLVVLKESYYPYIKPDVTSSPLATQ
jgi:hypothetical protein